MRKPTGQGRPAFACLLALLLTTLLSLSALAQIQNGTVSGDVTDPSGAAIPNAKVTIKNQATDFTTSTTGNQSGHFTFNQVPIGPYRVTVSAPGFKSESHTNVVVNAGSIAHNDFKLQVGAVSEVVEVTGAPPAVNTEDSKLGQTVSWHPGRQPAAQRPQRLRPDPDGAGRGQRATVSPLKTVTARWSTACAKTSTASSSTASPTRA